MVTCVILFYALMRIFTTKIKNNTISCPAVSALGLAFLAEMISMLKSLDGEANDWIYYVDTVSFTFSFGTLGFILFRIGVLATRNNLKDKAEFEINDTDEHLLTVDS